MKRRNLLRYGVEAAAVTALGTALVGSGVAESERPVIHPPGAPVEADFLGNCIKCGRCIQVCPPNSLGFAGFSDGLLASGSPKLVPKTAGCIAWEEECLDCIEACPTNALRSVTTDSRGIPTDEVIARAQIDDERCINCGNCDPICPVDAVFGRGHDGRETYSVDAEACVGCGRCVEICPVEGKAVDLFPPGTVPEYPIEMEVA